MHSMSDEQDKLKLSLEPPRLFGRKKKAAAEPKAPEAPVAAPRARKRPAQPAPTTPTTADSTAVTESPETTGAPESTDHADTRETSVWAPKPDAPETAEAPGAPQATVAEPDAPSSDPVPEPVVEERPTLSEEPELETEPVRDQEPTPEPVASTEPAPALEPRDGTSRTDTEENLLDEQADQAARDEGADAAMTGEEDATAGQPTEAKPAASGSPAAAVPTPTQKPAPKPPERAPKPAAQQTRKPASKPATRPAPPRVPEIEPVPVDRAELEDAEVAASLADERPLLPLYPAAAVTGGVIGGAMVLLTWLSLRGCEAVRGTSSCGGGPGFLLLVATFVVCVLLSSALLRIFAVPDPASTSFLAVGLVAVIALLFLIDALDHRSMLIVIPLLAVGAFLASAWVTKTFVEPTDTT